MWVYEHFPDDSMRIAWIQHDVYYDALRIIMDAARRRYSSAENVIDQETELGQKFNERSFDHRTLQWFHDAIAARFRYEYCVEASLFEICPDDIDEVDWIVRSWFQFLRSEIDKLLAAHSKLAARIGAAAFFANPDPRGMAAEDYLFNVTLLEYPMLNAAYRRQKKG